MWPIQALSDAIKQLILLILSFIGFFPALNEGEKDLQTEPKDVAEEVDDSLLLPGQGSSQSQQFLQALQEQQQSDEEQFIYFNNAGQGRFSEAVQQAGMEALHRPPWKMVAVDEEEQVRSLFAQLIRAPNGADDIAIMPSTAFAITLAAHNIARLYHQQRVEELKKLKQATSEKFPQEVKILVLQDQYPSAIYPWQEICDKKNLGSNNSLMKKKRSSGSPPSSPSNLSYNSNSSSSNTNNNDDHQHYSHGGISWSMHVVPYPEDEYGTMKRTWTESIVEHLCKASNRHAIQAVMLPPLHWADGRIIDLARIGQVCHKRHIPLIVDATQAVGIFKVDVLAEIQPALLACSTHKWLRGPSGTSLVYIHPSVHDTWLPLDQHERGRDMSNSDYYINAATRGHFMDPHTGYYPEAFFSNARKFDAGGKANPMLLPMLQASLQEVAQLNVESVQQSLKQIMQPLLKWCHDHNFVIPSQPHAYHIIGIQPPPYSILLQQPNVLLLSHQQKQQEQRNHYQERLSPKQLVQIARHLEQAHGIILQARCGGLRVAPYLDTTPQDVQALIDALQDIYFGSAVSVWANG
ncbi:hypothetical protein ACA910_016166 [Epithemia clementina (nom. ined.)]